MTYGAVTRHLQKRVAELSPDRTLRDISYDVVLRELRQRRNDIDAEIARVERMAADAEKLARHAAELDAEYGRID